MANVRHIVGKLVKAFGNECHYCGIQCNRIPDDPQQATKDHIIPKYFGGVNEMENYLLSCAKCNHTRGNQMMFCDCLLCGPKIEAALRDRASIDFVFYEMIRHNKPKIYRVSPKNAQRPNYLWCVKVGYGRRHFKTFEEAIDFSHNGFINRRTNGVR